MVRKIAASVLLRAPLLLGLALYAPGQQPTDQTRDTSQDDILILVNLTAKELRFDTVPDPKVEFPGTKERVNVWVTDRFNLPEKVEPGVTYRNIGMTLRISSRFADIEQIVKEALGEVPVKDRVTDTTAVKAVVSAPRAARTLKKPVN